MRNIDLPEIGQKEDHGQAPRAFNMPKENRGAGCLMLMVPLIMAFIGGLIARFFL